MRRYLNRLLGRELPDNGLGQVPVSEPQPEQQAPGKSNAPLTPKMKNSPIPIHRFADEISLPTIPLEGPKHKISFVVVVYKMPDQAEKTLYSLSTQYQRGVSEADYEVIVVENASSAVLGEQRACQYAGNVRYFYREETLPTPVPAVNFGASQASGSHITIMVDGARVLSPSVVSYMLAATRLHPQALVALPGYHLGPKLQQRSMLEGYCEEVEAELMASIGWPTDGYKLFEISCLSGTSTSGFFKPIGESNCYCVPRSVWDEVGGLDPAFTETGGGQVNLDFFKRTVELPDTVLVVLPGEGSFHQFHGGITTGTKGESRVKSMEDHFNQYADLRGGPYQSPDKRPIYLGSLPDSVMKFVKHGAVQAIKMLDQ